MWNWTKALCTKLQGAGWTRSGVLLIIGIDGTAKPVLQYSTLAITFGTIHARIHMDTGFQCGVSLVDQPVQHGALATFALGDAAHPSLMQVLEQAGPELLVTGRIVFLSDSGDRRQHYAVVDVEGIYAPLIVPVDQLRIARGDAKRLDAEVGVRSCSTSADRRFKPREGASGGLPAGVES